MIRYEERVDEALGVLRQEYGVMDQEAAELILAAQIPCDLPYPWLILDTPYYSLNTAGAWFSELGGEVTNLALMRVLRPRVSNESIKKLLQARDTAKLFVESHWEDPVKVHGRLLMWPYLLQECVRVRVEFPKRAMPTELSGMRLRKAVEDTGDRRWKREGKEEMPRMPPALPYYLELLQRLSPGVRNWEPLITNLTALAARRAYLYDRRVDSTDWQAIVRVMRDTVHPWTREILSNVGSQFILTSLKGRYYSVVQEELKRLQSNDIIQRYKGQWILRDGQERGRDVIELIHGQFKLNV